jgi:hypothetical protein
MDNLHLTTWEKLKAQSAKAGKIKRQRGLREKASLRSAYIHTGSQEPLDFPL